MLEDWIYEYGVLDEYAINAYWIERYQDCLRACQRLLRERKMPKDLYDRVKKNADFAAEKIKLQDLPHASATSRKQGRAAENRGRGVSAQVRRKRLQRGAAWKNCGRECQREDDRPLHDREERIQGHRAMPGERSPDRGLRAGRGHRIDRRHAGDHPGMAEPSGVARRSLRRAMAGLCL